MLRKVFAIYDSKAQVYSAPFMCSHVGEATRSFMDAVNDKGTLLNRHPEDYTLFEIASFDDCTAKYESLPTPKSLALAIELKREEK